MSVFDLLPGERADVIIEHESPHGPRAWGRVARRLGSPSLDRAPPSCPAFGRCGGCPLQTLRYGAQLAHKRQRVERALAASTPAAAPRVAETVPAPRAVGYRTRAKYVIARAGTGLTLGAYEPRSHRVVETLGCKVVEPAVDRAASATREVLAGAHLTVYDERTRRGELRYAVIRSGAAGEVLVGLVTTSAASRRELQRAGARLAEHPDVTGVVWIRNDRRSSAIITTDIEILAGAGVVGEEVGGTRAEIDITAFTQINRDQARRLYRAAGTMAGIGPGARALELYCGIGGMSLELAGAGADVVGVERHAPAVAVAERAARRAGRDDRARFFAEDAAEFLASAADRARYDLIVVDPPRKGLEAEARAAIARARAPRLLYVSCDPNSFARDAAELGASGYELERVEPWDLMPGTPQVEILARFRRREPRAGSQG